MLHTDTENSGYHYNVMRRAITLIDAAEDNLSLEDMAAQMGMSAAHFQRVFSRWVGVSPKRYQQYLTLGHAKTLLHSQFSTVDTAHASGLSGSGRLHDLFLRWEAMSPGEYAKHGAGLVINWGWFDTPFGRAIVMGTDRGICGLGFAAEIGEDAAFIDLRQRWPDAQFMDAPEELEGWVNTAFGINEGGGKAPLLLMGGPFQIKVWEALLSVPSGQVTSYSEIAEIVGSPKAVRAVGTAVGRNPVSWLIPCHRALRKSGAMGGYHWGLPMKRAMLAYEAAKAEA
ncbi:MAG: AraC family transcriptional regulator of adaptative response [Ascidiaceihabitans sp.]|jgi:AraC family transcriptional regulator of adaptative response/methylated-DNA-[protein]-cysteine methyltransferase|tara:strand:+ start:572 stop:1423 length:852 start_codon:yes stop_codon:yes gene_type:complete